ncbi:nucleolar protein 8 [Entomortierella parvispora]|uniref:Nucleolar protein 8 n=1 Tax=Entomortierella parvispora TaxID=205924 RepID=A0A9P3LRS3_9FUNG|nr:nucleolar protein 8 [Entomortierella parvispora]
MKSEPLFDKADAGALGATEKPAKVKKPKVPKPAVDPNEHISQRAFIGGLAKDVTPNDVEGRFKSFGKLTDVYLAKDVDGSCRGFGYVTLDTTRKDWSKCVALFNGAKWKGHVLKIEEANKDWQTKRQEDLEKQAKMEKKEKDALVKKFKRQPAKHAEDMSLITDKNMDGKRGWKRGRFGRPVITMKMDRMTYDPSHYKNNVEKLFNLQAKPLPLSELVYQIDENEPVPKGKHLPSEVALAPFLSKAATITSTATTIPATNTKKETTSTKSKDTPSSLSSASLDETSALNTSDDRAMMASVLAGLDMSPRAMSLDGSDFEDDDDMRGSYAEEFGGPLKDTTADDMFGDLDLAPAEVVPKSKRDSRPEDLFGDDDDEEDQSSRPSLDFLEDEEDDEEGEYDEDQEEEEEEEEEEEDEGEYEEDQDDEEEEEYEEEEEDEDMDEDTRQAIAQLQGTSSSSGGGLFDSDDDESEEPKDAASKFAEESNAARLKAQEAREAELEATREKQQQLIASQLANLDSRDKKEGHVVFADSDDYDSEDYEKMEADHNKKMARLNKPAKSIFDSDSGSDEEEEEEKTSTKTKKGAKEMFASDDEEGEEDLGRFGEKNLIKEQFEGPGGKALFQMQTRIGTSDSRFQLTKDFLDERIRAEDDQDFVAHQDRLRDDEMTTNGDGAAEIVLDEDRQVESNVSAEKMQAMSVLRAMFGESAVRSKKKEEDSARKAMGGVGFTTGLTVRYDPDAAPPPPPPTTTKPVEDDDSKLTVFDSESDSEDVSKAASSKPVLESESESEDQDMEDIEENSLKAAESEKPAKKSVGFSFAFDAEALDKDEDDTSASSPAVVKDLDTSTKFQVATDLKSLFAPAAGSFKMFGGDDDEEEDEDKENDDGRDVEDDSSHLGEDRSQEQEESILTSYSQGSKTIFGNEPGRQPLSHSGSMFFFHFKNPTLLKRSNFKTTNKVFMRTETMDEVTAHWEKTRHTMTQEFKRKHKSASRNKARATKRFKSNQHGDGHGG